MEKVQAFIKSASRLPAPPALVMKIIRMTNDPDTEISDIVELFQTNSALSARLLKLANSVFYGLRGEVTSVYRATVLLGIKTIRSLAVTVWTHSISNEYQEEELQDLLSTLFLHSAAVAVIGQEIAKRVGPSYMDDVFLSGLLHDFGRLAMLCENLDTYENSLLKLKSRDRDDLFRAEAETFGFNHAELGGALATTWGFPEFLVQSAENHHNPSLCLESQPIPTMVFLADKLANAVLENVANGVKPFSAEPSTWALIGIEDVESQTAFLSDCKEKLENLLASIA